MTAKFYSSSNEEIFESDWNEKLAEIEEKLEELKNIRIESDVRVVASFLFDYVDARREQPGSWQAKQSRFFWESATETAEKLGEY